MRAKISLLLLILILSCSRGKFVKRTYLAMGTVVNITVPASSPDVADSAFFAIHLVDSLMNPISPLSDLNRINRDSGHWVRVSHYTVLCLKRALEIAELTEGAFDPTVGRVVHLFHFDRAPDFRMPPEDSIRIAREYVDFRKIWIRGDSVRIGRGQQITLAAIAKGFAIDLACEKLDSLGVSSYIVEAGGDLRVRMPRGAKIGIRSPRGEGLFGVLKLKDGAACTSGDYERFFYYRGKRYSHIFDPRTGMPVEDELSVTVIGPDATTVDALSTALFVLGSGRGLKLLERLENYEALFIERDGVSMSPGFRKYLEEVF